ncbi:hypothetical protein [Streptomonospora wellingtoniae]|uniref:Uncharacterized protein n=1 Tax=Streptomonospora wellingtoniae TaxID=3075544 RepID=A0ABU2KUB0_9ACTN|nr:hypothetical protein [Streptomonospora sp. DSM 45055]MDT0302881.1 hypothetical protein [Streptomonospora sp. DSM 45055]
MSAATEPYRYIPDGTGRIEVPGRLCEDHGEGWDIVCYLWGGAEYYYVTCRRPAPADAEAWGIEQSRRGPSTADRIRQWIVEQEQAWAAWEDAHP